MDPLNRMILVYAIRAACLAVFLASSVSLTFSWRSLFTFITLAGSVYFLPVRSTQKQTVSEKEPKTKEILNDLYPSQRDDELERQYGETLTKIFLYDPENTPAVNNFEIIRQQSNCLFAKTSKVWGSPEWKNGLSLEEYIYRLVPMLIRFTIYTYSKRLDAFLIELPGLKYGRNIQEFGHAVCTVLRTLSDNDPAGVHCMNRSYIAGRGWVFEFNKCTFFITTFAPFYPTSHPRYTFGADHCYLLMQPELSFALRDLPQYSPDTNWNTPQTVRDKIRCAFRDAGRPTYIPESDNTPMILEILRPVNVDDPVCEWWKGQAETV